MRQEVVEDRPERSVEDATVRQLALAPLPPAQMTVEQYMNGVRITCEGRDRIVERDGAVSYRIRWTATADTSSLATANQARVRSTIIDSFDAPGKAKLTVERLILDHKFASGYFIAEGIDSRGNASEEYVIAGPVSSEILDSTIPADGTHLQISGSGEYIGSDVVEALSVSIRQPLPLGSFDGFQLFLQDYINMGTMQEGEFHRGNGVAGASMQFKVNYSLSQRIGIGQVTVTAGIPNVLGTGTRFTLQCKPGDVLEFANHRVAILNVVDDLHLTLVSNWLWLTSTAPAFCFYGKVTIYVVSISKGGTHRADVTNAPSAALVFDGSLGVPNAPAGITATTLGNAIRIEFAAVVGTQIKSYRLYRGVGSSVAFPICQLLDEIPNPKNVSEFSSNIQFEDSSFTPYQKEQGQFFTYYVTTGNERGDESAAAGPANASCRLDSPDDTENGGRVGLKNQLYNAMFAGTIGNNVAEGDTSQDAFLFTDGGNLPGKPFGGGGAVDGTGRYQGYTRWHSTKTGGAAALATHQNGNEVKLPAPGAGQFVYVYQEIGAWDDGRPRFMKAKKNGFIVFQIKMRHGGVTPSGALHLIVEQYNNNVVTGNAQREYRDSSSNILFATGGASNFIVNGSQLLSTPQIFWAIYQYDGSLGTTKQIRFTFGHTGASGDIYLSEPEVNEGTDRGAWTADMGDQYTSHPVGSGPSAPDTPRDGLRPWHIA